MLPIPPAEALVLAALALAGVMFCRAHQQREYLHALPQILPLLVYAGLYAYIAVVPGTFETRVSLVRWAMLLLFSAWIVDGLSVVVDRWTRPR